MKRIVKISLVVVVALVLITGALGTGVAIGYSGILAQAQNVEPSYHLASAERGEQQHGVVCTADPPCGALADFDTFWQAWDIVHDRFIDRDALDKTELEYGAIRGMIEAGCAVRGFPLRGFWSDIGTPKDLEKTREVFGGTSLGG